MLVVERIALTRTLPLHPRANRRCFVNCFKLSLPAGSSEVAATETYSFNYEGHHRSREIVSDHSGKYYAAYFWSRPLHSNSGEPDAIQIWDIVKGEMIRRISGPFFPESPRVTFKDVMVVAKHDPNGPQQVVIAGRNRSRRDDSQSFHGWLGRWSSHTELRVFPIEEGSFEWGGYVMQDPACLASAFKVSRSPTGITSVDDPTAPEYESERIGLAFWQPDPRSELGISSYHNLIPDQLASAPRVPLTADGECRIGGKESSLPLSPFVVQGRSGLSFTMDRTSCSKRIRGMHMNLNHLCLRGFYPSTTPGIMDLEWETYLKSPNSSKQIRQLCSEGPPRSSFRITTKDFCGDEYASAFLESREGDVYVVLVVWDEPFHGEVMNGVMLA
jgi:hypothetical protein